MIKIKKIHFLFLTVVLLFNTMGTTAFAAEARKEPTYSSVYTTESLLTTTTYVNNTFLVYGEHTGSTRSYSGSYLRYRITVTDQSGNPVENILAVRLYTSGGTLIHEGQVRADGSTTIFQDIPISSDTYYYFKYLNAYGTLRNLNVTMVIESYS